MNCTNCCKPTSNPKFCSRSCSAKFTNKAYPKRKAVKKYCKCGTELPTKRAKVCQSCNVNYVNWELTTIGELRNNRKYQIHSRMRTLARSKYLKSDKPKECTVCGYDFHFDVCHIVPIHSFPDSTTVSEINSLDNLTALCKNHHWEFDRGYLSLSSFTMGA